MTQWIGAGGRGVVCSLFCGSTAFASSGCQSQVCTALSNAECCPSVEIDVQQLIRRFIDFVNKGAYVEVAGPRLQGAAGFGSCVPRSLKMAAAMEPASLEHLCVLYQSDDFIVVDKHWDLRIDSKMWYEKNTVQSQLRHRFPELADPNTYYGFRFCHQLDFSTSGALCVALNKAAAGQAFRCFKDRTVTKAYLALLRGWVEKEKQTLDFSIGKNSTEGRTHMMCIEGAEGCEKPKACQTELSVLEYGMYDGEPVTKVLLQPLTGRTHQLRVHCGALGHPIVGDFTYSLGADAGPYRMMLHAHLLRIPLEPQGLQVTAGDPFLPAVDPKWLPQRRLQTAEGAVQALLESVLTKEEGERKSREAEEERRKGKGVAVGPRSEGESREEDEEQKTMCQDWLSEWGSE